MYWTGPTLVSVMRMTACIAAAEESIDFDMVKRVLLATISPS